MTILIAGAGIGGLSAALALAGSGHSIEIVERAPVLDPLGAGIQLSPNATRILRKIGVLEAIAACSTRPDCIRIRRGRDGADLARVPLGDASDARFGAPFLLIHRADLHAVLMDAVASQSDIRLRLGVSVESYRIEGDQLAVTFGGAAAPRAETVAGLIGADGLRSNVRAGRGGEPIYGGRTAWRALVPAAAAPAPSRRPTSNLWLGPNAHLVHYPVRGGRDINVVAIIQDEWRGERMGEFWSRPGDARVVRTRYAGWSAEARNLIEAAEDWRVWPLYERAPLPAWSDGPVTLLGDAAHPMLPFLAQGSAQAIEDAWVLGQTMRQAGPGDIPRAFRLYETARRRRAERVQRESRRQGTIYHLGWPAAAARDLALVTLGPARMLSRYDWLYGENVEYTSAGSTD